jgi:hypothetical protein
MKKIIIIESCIDCPKNISGDSLASRMGRFPELRGKRVCSLIDQFIKNPKMVQDFCPLKDEEQTEQPKKRRMVNESKTPNNVP